MATLRTPLKDISLVVPDIYMNCGLEQPAKDVILTEVTIWVC